MPIDKFKDVMHKLTNYQNYLRLKQLQTLKKFNHYLEATDQLTVMSLMKC